MQLIAKRLIDVALAAAALALLSPLMLFIFLCARVLMGSPVLFRQQRAGLKGKPLELLKFRSMTNERDDKGEPLPDDNRLTTTGKILRATSLDELPQLVNVLKGEMSLIGPRPLPVKYMARYNKRQALRHNVKPGITGWVQATYRGEARSWDERLELDVWYVENWSLWLDIKIIFLTLYTLFLRPFSRKKREKASQIEFMGSKYKTE